jgi:hypothetical protein
VIYRLVDSLLHVFRWAQRSRLVREQMEERKQIVVNEARIARVRRNMIEKRLIGEE